MDAHFLRTLRKSIHDFNALKGYTLLTADITNKIEYGNTPDRYIYELGEDKETLLLENILMKLTSLDCIPAYPQIAYQTIINNITVRFRPTIHVLYPKNKANKLIERFQHYNKTSYIYHHNYSGESFTYNIELIQHLLPPKDEEENLFLQVEERIFPYEAFIDGKWQSISLEDYFRNRRMDESPTYLGRYLTTDDTIDELRLNVMGIKIGDFQGIYGPADNTIREKFLRDNVAVISIMDMGDETMSNDMFVHLLQAAHDIFLI